MLLINFNESSRLGQSAFSGKLPSSVFLSWKVFHNRPRVIHRADLSNAKGFPGAIADALAIDIDSMPVSVPLKMISPQFDWQFSRAWLLTSADLNRRDRQKDWKGQKVEEFSANSNIPCLHSLMIILCMIQTGKLPPNSRKAPKDFDVSIQTSENVNS